MSYRRNTYSRPRNSGGGWRGPPAMEMLNESIVMSGTDTFTEIEVALLEEVGKLRFGRVKAMMIVRAEVEIHPTPEAAGEGIDLAVATDQWLLQCTSASQAVEVNFDDRDCIFKMGQYYGAAAPVVDQHPTKDFPMGGLPYFKKRIWFGCDTVGSAGADTIRFKLYYYFKYLNKKQQTRIISQLQ